MGLSKYLPRAVALSVLIAAPASAADMPALPAFPSVLGAPRAATAIPDVEYFMPRPILAWQGEIGARYWYGNARTGKSLYDLPSVSNAMISRLTYGDLTTHAGELYGRAAFTGGWFIKGYAGGGSIVQGVLHDEDFPPGITPYSDTSSPQHGGTLGYGSADLGYDVLRGGDFRLGGFAGYHYFYQVVNAFGCMQTATNPFVCQPAIPTQFQAVTQNNTWQSVRVGLEGSVKFGGRFTFTAEGAWLPYVHVEGFDDHWLRMGGMPGDFAGGIGESGKGWGYQFEGQFSYAINEYTSVGVGARYWHMQAHTNATENFVGGPSFVLPENWKTDIFGVFLQASLKLGPYPLGLAAN